MQKRKPLILILLLCFIGVMAAFFFTACGEKAVKAPDPSITDPADNPTENPTDNPTDEPTDESSDDPSNAPTNKPSEDPSDEPTDEPSAEPEEPKKEEHKHSFIETVTQPTCTEEGYTTHICACGESFVDTFVDALGHDLLEHAAKEPTCTDIGCDAYAVCARCGYSTYHEIAAMGHDFVDDFCTRCGTQESSAGLLYVLSTDKTYYIVAGIGSRTDREIVIASVYNGLPVKEIASGAFQYNYNITSVKIPDSVVSIGSEAFDGCIDLKSVTLGNSLSSISDYAFYCCDSLTSIEIPDSVTSIGRSVFYNCTSLVTVTMGNGVTSIGSHTFFGCTSLTDFRSPERVTAIGSDAFSGCTSLKSIVIPACVTSIGSDAFSDCRNLTSVIFENTSGWTCKGVAIGEAALRNPLTAATYLTKTHTAAWNRKEN